MVAERHYDIHGLVRVSARGDSALLQEVDHHLGSFRSALLGAPANIIIDRYEAAPFTPPATVVEDYIYGAGAYHRSTTRFRVDALASPQTYYMDRLELPINLIVQLALLRTGHTLLHGAGLLIDDRNVLFPAYPGTGKTTLVAAFVHRGASLFGDDLCIVGQGRIYSYPQALSLYEHHLPILHYRDRSIERSFRRTHALDRVIRYIDVPRSRALKAVRFLLSALRTPAVNVEPQEIFGPEAIAGEGVLSEIVALERSGETEDLVEERVHPSDLADQAAIILWHEWHASFHHLLLYDALAETGHGTVERIATVRDIALRTFQGLNCSRVRIPASWDNATLVEQFPAFWKNRN